MKKTLTFNNFLKINEANTSSNIQKGDLVWNKEVGQAGLIGLVVSDARQNDDEETVYDVLYRGYNGDILETRIDEIEDIIKAGKLYDGEHNGDLISYFNIAKKQNIILNPKYLEIIEDDSNNDNNEPSKTKEIKLLIIENFIDWFTSSKTEREALKDAAKTYVDEDNVDEIIQAFPDKF